MYDIYKVFLCVLGDVKNLCVMCEVRGRKVIKISV